MCEPRKLTVYVIRSVANPARHYVGVTANLQKRIAGHNAGQNVYTARDRPWAVVVSLEFGSDRTAIQFERYLKTGSGRAFAKRHFA
jgi:predicted GIY-YIG superfamily endonuclease